MLAAFKLLEEEVARSAPTIESQPGLTIAVVWRFAQMMVADIVAASAYPALQQYSLAAEKHPAFLAFPPDGPGVPSN